MKKLRITALALCLSVALSLTAPCVLAEDEGAPKLNSAQSALIGDLSSGRILYNVDAYSRRFPASLTKIMTLLLAVEAVEQGTASLDDMVTAGSDSQSGLTEYSSSSGICIGETMSMKDLLYCAALASANEACNIIAGHVAGSISAFVEKMNALVASNDVQLDEPAPQPATPQELSHEQKLTIVIVCAITVLLLLVFILLLVRRQKRMNNKQ